MFLIYLFKDAKKIFMFYDKGMLHWKGEQQNEMCVFRRDK